MKGLRKQDLRPKDGEHGKDGKDGKHGIDGKDGKDGKDGIDATGIDGKDGENGLDGKDGKDGKSIKGDEGKRGLKGLKGDKGKTGNVGKQGKSIKGDDGDKGDSGLSAYEIAKKHGYEGTERKWLRSLKGEKGKAGTAGLGGLIGGGVAGGVSVANDHLFSQYEKKTVANTATETTLMGGGYGSITIPANHFNTRGKPLHLMVMGGWDKGANTTLTLKVKITQDGVTTIHHTKFFSNARLGGTVGGHWEIRAMFNCYTTGTSGNMMMHAMLQLLENDSAEILGLHSETPEFAFDTTLPFDVFATAEWGTANSLNTIHSSNVMIW